MAVTLVDIRSEGQVRSVRVSLMPCSRSNNDVAFIREQGCDSEEAGKLMI